jgi:hypothetical protein
MTLQERSFAGQQFRSRPTVHEDAAHSLVLVITPWGDRSAAQTIIRIFEGHFVSAMQDIESTSPFGRIEGLSDAANHLRVAMMLANDAVLQNHNRDTYTVGVEVLALHIAPEEIVWTQAGQPSLLLNRLSSPHLHVLSSQFDLSWNHAQGSRQPPPLPSQMLGLHRQSNIAVQSFRPRPKDRLIFLSRSDFPADLLTLPAEQRDLDGLSRVLARENPSKPFWIAEREV